MLLRKSSDLLIIVFFTVVAAVVVLTGAQNLLRIVFALPLVFLFPGYVLIAAMFPQKGFPFETNIVLAVALSIAVTVLSGLFLHFTAWGMQTRSWLLILTEIVLFAGAIAIVRRTLSTTFTNYELHLNLHWSQAALFGLALILGFVAIGIARNGVLNQTENGFTQLWILPGLPETPQDIRLGIRNDETTPVSYRLVVKSGNTVLENWDAIHLASGEQWQGDVTVNTSAIEQPGSSIDADLYRSDAPETVYRKVSLASNNQATNP